MIKLYGWDVKNWNFIKQSENLLSDIYIYIYTYGKREKKTFNTNYLSGPMCYEEKACYL